MPCFGEVIGAEELAGTEVLELFEVEGGEVQVAGPTEVLDVAGLVAARALGAELLAGLIQHLAFEGVKGRVDAHGLTGT